MTDHCNTCKYWEPTYTRRKYLLVDNLGEGGICKRYAPSYPLIIKTRYEVESGQFPAMNAGNWCGEYTFRQKEFNEE